MSKTVLIVEKDVSLMRSLHDALAGRGFEVEETTDGKGAPELIRKKKPDCVVLAVDLDAGQNGYILCKKLKSDDELRAVPVIIIGDPKGFGQHQKLKTRAEDYVGKPFERDALVDHVGGLVGFPPQPEPELEPELAPLGDDFDPGALIDEEEPLITSEEVAIEPAAAEQVISSSDSDFEMVDAMFEDTKATSGISLEPPPVGDEGALATLEPDGDAQAEKTMVGFVPPGTAPAKERRAVPHAYQSAPSSIVDPAEARELRSRVTELTESLEEARTRSTELENRVREVEQQLESRQADLEGARASGGGKSDKEVFALRDSVNKKDKEILRLKTELNAKETEIVELREKENTLDQQLSEGSGEMARRDAQLKTLQSKADQLTGERRRLDQQLITVREEARAASTRLATLQADFDALQPRTIDLENELEGLRSDRSDSENARQQLTTELAEARGELDAVKSQVEERARESDELRSQLEQAQIDLDSARNQVSSQAQAFADEISGLRDRINELDAETSRHLAKAQRHAQRVKAQQELISRAKEAVELAKAALEEPAPDEADDLDVDELAEA